MDQLGELTKKFEQIFAASAHAQYVEQFRARKASPGAVVAIVNEHVNPMAED